jgi:adhesin/invasin
MAVPLTLPASGTSTSVVGAQVTNSAGAPVAGDVITFSVSGTCGSLASLSGTTDATGVVTTTYTSSTSIGFCTVKASEAATGLSASVTITQTDNPVPAPNTVALAASPSTLPADGASNSSIAVTVTNPAGTAIAGDPLLVRTNGGPSCGSLNPSTLVTNALGMGFVNYTASSKVGFCTITAIEAASGTSGTVVITQTQPPNVIAASANPSSIKADGTSTSTVTITVTTAGGIAVAGDSLTLNLSAIPVGACGLLSALASTTNAIGQATVTYTASTTVGSCTIRATDASGGTGGVLITQT